MQPAVSFQDRVEDVPAIDATPALEPPFTPAFLQIQEVISAEITALWQTDEVRRSPPTVLDEIYMGLDYTPVLFRTIPQLYGELQQGFRMVYGDAPVSAGEFPCVIQFGSWIGGDRDGNPHVTAGTTEQALRTVRAQAIRLGKVWNKQFSEPALCSFNICALGLEAVVGLLDGVRRARRPGLRRRLLGERCGLGHSGFDGVELLADYLEGLLPPDVLANVPEKMQRFLTHERPFEFREVRDAQYPLALISPASERTISSTLAELPRPEVRLLMHPDDAMPRGVSEGDAVRVFNTRGEVRCYVTIGTWIRPGTVSLPKGLWRKHTTNGYTANALVPDTLTDLGGGACFNDARVQVELWGRH